MPRFPTLGPVSNAWGHLVKFHHKKEGGKFQIASAFQGSLAGKNGGRTPGACASARSWAARRLRSRDGLRQGKPRTPQADTDGGSAQGNRAHWLPPSSGSTSHLRSLGEAGSRPDFVSKAPAPPTANHSDNHHEIPQPPWNLFLHGKREEEAGRLTPHGAFSRVTSSSRRGFWLPPAWR